MRQERVVELFFGESSHGSGYLITTQHVLTARHVVDGHGESCDVQPLLAVDGDESKRPRPLRARVDWFAEEPELDFAVVKLEEALKLPSIDAPTPMARIPRGENWCVPFHGVGFPRAAGIVSRPIRGSLSQVPDATRLDLELDVRPAVDLRDWKGLSGAVVFHDGFAVGVVGKVDPKWVGGKFEATPVHYLLGAKGFEDYWRQQSLPLLELTKLRRAPDPSPDLDLAELLAWCDRTRLVEAIDNHLNEPKSPQAALLAVSGDAANRVALLMDRLGVEQADPPRQRRVKVAHIDKDYGFDNPDQVGKAALEKLGLRSATEVSTWIAKQDLDLLLLGHYADCTDWSGVQIRAWLTNTAAWLHSLILQPQQRVLLLSNLRFSTSRTTWWKRLLGANTGLHDRVEAAHQQAMQSELFASRSAGGLVKLGEYPKEDLRKWLSLDRVRSGLGRAANEIDEFKLDQWFSSGYCEHEQLLRHLRQLLGSHGASQRTAR